LNSIALAMRDMLDTTEPYPLTAWSAQFDRIHQDLDAGLKLEESLAVVNRTPEQRQYLAQSLSQFWDAVNRMFALAKSGKEPKRESRFDCRYRRASKRSARLFRGSWWKIMKAKSRPRYESLRFTMACSTSSTFF